MSQPSPTPFALIASLASLALGTVGCIFFLGPGLATDIFNTTALRICEGIGTLLGLAGIACACVSLRMSRNTAEQFFSVAGVIVGAFPVGWALFVLYMNFDFGKFFGH